MLHVIGRVLLILDYNFGTVNSEDHAISLSLSRSLSLSLSSNKWRRYLTAFNYADMPMVINMVLAYLTSQ